MRGTPTRLPYWPQLMRPMDLPPSRSSFVSWSESNDRATAERAPPGHDFGRYVRPARTWLTRRRQCSSGHCQGSRGFCSVMEGSFGAVRRAAVCYERQFSTGEAMTIPKIALVMGDAAGVGIELAARLLASPDEVGETGVLAIGDAGLLNRGAAVAGLTLDVPVVRDAGEAAFRPGRPELLDLGHDGAGDIPQGVPTR